MDLSTLIVAGLTVGYGLYWFWRRRLYQLAADIPGPPSLPLLGSIKEFMGDPHTVFENLLKKSEEYGDVVKFWVGPRLLVFISNPADIELVLSSHVHIDKSPEYSYFQPWLGDGLLISTGEKWRNHRKLIAPTFHLSILKSFIPLFNRNSIELVEKLKREIGKEFDCHGYMSEATVEMLLETAMGVNERTQESGYEYAAAVMKMCDILHLRHTKIWLRPRLVFYLTSLGKLQTKLLDIIHRLTKKVLTIRLEEYKKNGNKLPGNVSLEADDDGKVRVEGDFSFGHSRGLIDDLDESIGEKRRLAFLDLLIDASQGGKLTNEEIQNQVDTIMFEGHDTTAAASSFFLCMMAARPDIQKKCIEELIEIFGGSDRPVTFEDTLKMKYIERCLMETLRMYPPVPVIGRELQHEVKLVSRDLVIPANCTVIVATFKLHRKANIYPNPDVFDPDNFLPQRYASRHFYSFIPFSAGPRSCVGRKYAMLKLKILLANILRNYRVLPGKKEDDWKLKGDIILKRSDGFGIRIEPRCLNFNDN